MTWDPPDPPAPEDDPQSYADYLRCKIVSRARSYCLAKRPEHARKYGLRADPRSYVPWADDPVETQLEELCQALVELDRWKKEFGLEDLRDG